MIELKQHIDDIGVRFDISGEKKEIMYVLNWLDFYGQAHTFCMSSDLPDADYKNMSAFVHIDNNVNEQLNKVDFAVLFKLTFCKFELNLPDATNADSELMRRLEALVEATCILPENPDTGLDRDVLDELKKELGLK